MAWFSRRPDPLAERAAAPGVLFAASGVRIRAGATNLRIPGGRTSRAVRLHRGSVVVTADHLAITFRSFLAVDGSLREEAGTPAQVHFDADGVHVAIDLGTALRSIPGKNSGTLTIDVAAPISPDVLATLPTGPLAVGYTPVQVSAVSRRV